MAAKVFSVKLLSACKIKPLFGKRLILTRFDPKVKQ